MVRLKSNQNRFINLYRFFCIFTLNFTTMKKYILFLLLSIAGYGQTSTGQEQEFPYGILVPVSVLQTVTAPTYFATFGSTGVLGKAVNSTDLLTNDSTVTGATTTDALNTLNTTKAGKSEVVLKTDTEGARLDNSLTPIYGWGDSLTEGSGGTPYPTTLQSLTTFTVTNKGVGGDTSTQIKTRFLAEPANFGKSVIIWAGRNNYTDPTTVKADIASMVASLGHTRYLIVSVLNGDFGTYERIGGAGYIFITQLNADLKALYGDKYVEVREFLVSQHNQTAQDLLDFADDIPPTSLRSDAIHLNSAGYTKVAEFLNKKLGILYNQDYYLQSKDLAYYSVQNQNAITQTGSFKISGAGTVGSLTSLGDLNVSVNSTFMGNSFIAGTLGIGTGAPSRKLSVEDSGSVYLSLNDNTNSKYSIGSDSNGLVFFNDTASGYLGAFAKATGNLLIGTLDDSTGAKLRVNGAINATSYTGTATLTGTPTAPTATAGTSTTQIATTKFVQDAKALTVRKISTNTTLADSDNGTVILLTASCTVTLPNGLMSGFNVSFSTATGATLTYALGGSVTLINNAGTTMAQNLSHTIVNTGTSNEYLTAGSL